MSEIIAGIALLMIPKNQCMDLVYGLTHQEFQCRCKYEECDHTLISSKLLNGYAELRARHGKPLKINSGFRCMKHNNDVKGMHQSYHKKGMAIDISTHGFDWGRKQDLINDAKEIFDFVKVYSRFIHVHFEHKRKLETI